MDEKVVHKESLTGFIADLPVGVYNGGVDRIDIATSQSALNTISHRLGRCLSVRIGLTNGGSSGSCLLYSVDNR